MALETVQGMETEETGVSEGAAQPSNATEGAADEEETNEEKAAAKPARGIEQRPFLTQTELLIKMKAGDDEEVKRCYLISLMFSHPLPPQL